MPDPAPLSRARSYVAIALVSSAVLLYEITITRVLSVVLWYHFAFLAISLAMLGLGAPGVWFTLRRPSERALARCLVLGAFTLPVSMTALLKGSEWVPHVAGLLPGIMLTTMLCGVTWYLAKKRNYPRLPRENWSARLRYFRDSVWA